MAEANITFTDEEMKLAHESFADVQKMIEANRSLNASPFSSKEEVAARFNQFLEFFEQAFIAGSMLVDGSIEINELTESPDSE